MEIKEDNILRKCPLHSLLAYMRGEQIAIELDYGIDNVYILHRKALDQITVPETLQ